MTGKRSDPSYDYPPEAKRETTVMSVHLSVWFAGTPGGAWLPVGNAVKTNKLRESKHSWLATCSLYGGPTVVGTYRSMDEAARAVRTYARKELA